MDLIFQNKQSKEVIAYIRKKYQDDLEFLWFKFPKNAIWRRKDTQKWYGALLILSQNKLGLKGEEDIEIIDLRGKPEVIASLVDGKKYFPGYHMNKRNWFTIILDGSVSTKEIFNWIDASYDLAKK